MTIFQEVTQVRDYMASMFGEGKVSKLDYSKGGRMEHSVYNYSFVLKGNKPIQVTVITSWDNHFREASYILEVGQKVGDELNGHSINLTKRDMNSQVLIDKLHNEFGFPRVKK